MRRLGRLAIHAVLPDLQALFLRDIADDFIELVEDVVLALCDGGVVGVARIGEALTVGQLDLLKVGVVFEQVGQRRR